MQQKMFSLSSLTVIQGHDLKWRLIRSLALLLSYVIHGMFLGTIGPTMLDIQIRTNSSIVDVTYVIIGRAVGMSIGTFLGTFFSSLSSPCFIFFLQLVRSPLTLIFNSAYQSLCSLQA